MTLLYQHGVFFLIDNKSFYASCEAVARGLNPLKVPLVVLSEAENTNGGLILATSPEAKHLFHLKANVSRKRDLPNDHIKVIDGEQLAKLIIKYKVGIKPINQSPIYEINKDDF